MKRLAIYGRVSTKRHQEVETQLQPLREYAERRGWAVQSEYIDIGISGAKASRPQLDAMMKAGKQRAFDVVLVWKFDRFARSTMHLATALAEFQSLGIDFVSLTEAVDTSTPVGKMTFTVLGAVAELERSLIVERVKAGLRNARAKGKRLGRPKVHADAAKIATLRNAGLSWSEIMRETGLTKGTAQRAFYSLPKIPCRAIS